MPNQNHPLNRVLISAVGLTMLFAILVLVVPANPLLTILNGVFAGCVVALVVTFWSLVWNAVLGRRPYDRVRQMALGLAVCWAAYILGVLISIYLMSSGLDPAASYAVAASRYIAIIAAVLQVTAPDFGFGVFHGRDRKTLWTAVILGLLVASMVIVLQGTESLAEKFALPNKAALSCAIGADVSEAVW